MVLLGKPRRLTGVTAAESRVRSGVVKSGGELSGATRRIAFPLTVLQAYLERLSQVAYWGREAATQHSKAIRVHTLVYIRYLSMCISLCLISLCLCSLCLSMCVSLCISMCVSLCLSPVPIRVPIIRVPIIRVRIRVPILCAYPVCLSVCLSRVPTRRYPSLAQCVDLGETRRLRLAMKMGRGFCRWTALTLLLPSYVLAALTQSWSTGVSTFGVTADCI